MKSAWGVDPERTPHALEPASLQMLAKLKGAVAVSYLPEWGMPTVGQPVCKTAERDSESSYSSRMDAIVFEPEFSFLHSQVLRSGGHNWDLCRPGFASCDSPASDRSGEPFKNSEALFYFTV